MADVIINCTTGGVPKHAVPEAVLTMTGLAGDYHAKTEIHGGPERALCLYALELIHRLQDEGHPIFPGSIGENVTLAGLDWAALQPGTRLALGETVIEISSYTSPCKTIAASFTDGAFSRIAQKLHPGWSRLYARVLKAGRLATGETARVLNGSDDSTD